MDGPPATAGTAWPAVRLERIRGLQRLGLPLRQIADLLDAPEPQVRQALAEIVTGIQRDIAALAATAAHAQDHLTTPSRSCRSRPPWARAT